MLAFIPPILSSFEGMRFLMSNDEAFGTLDWGLFDKLLFQSNFIHIRQLPQQIRTNFLSHPVSLCVIFHVNNCYKVFYFLYYFARATAITHLNYRRLLFML